jgi:ATP phosphoribosyltransferase regulatory subunit
MNSALLPPGFYDVLPPASNRQAEAVAALMAHFQNHGYARVDTPLMEFEESLLSGPGAALTSSTFRAMDPASHRMLGFLTDHTLQIGRIAESRMGDLPRPLRLSYSGRVVSASSGGTHAARQKTQVGVELIGSMEAQADAEAILLGASALAALGITEVSVDLLLPTLVPALAEEAGLNAEQKRKLHDALDRKDEAAVQAAGSGKIYETALALLRAGGAADKALKVLESLPLPEKAKADRDRLKKVLALLGNIPAKLSIDLVETRCFEYQTGLSFSFFSGKSDGVLGRGGRYRTQANEPSTGFTFYAETLVLLLPESKERPRILVPFDCAATELNKLHGEGYITLRALNASDLRSQAKTQGCDFIWENEKAVKS